MRKKQIALDCFEDKYNGYIVVQRMTHDELNKVREDFGLLDGVDTKERSNKENYEFMVNVYKRAKNYLIEAKVKRLSDDTDLSLEDLDFETELNKYQGDIATAFLSGWAMGNEKEQQ